jgi:TrpR-related protein YerC/YecD
MGKSIDFKNLYSAILSLENEEDCKIFFEDICTMKELETMSQRLEVANLLSKGNNYQEISQKTGASTATISRVNKCLNYGAGGYNIVVKSKGKK